MDELLKETKRLLTDLLRNGSFYYSAIELDRFVKNPVNGEEFEKRIKELLKKIKNKN